MLAFVMVVDIITACSHIHDVGLEWRLELAARDLGGGAAASVCCRWTPSVR